MCVCVFIHVNCLAREEKLKEKKYILLQKKCSTPLRQQHFKILPEAVHSCPTKTSHGRYDRSWLFLSELNSHHKGLFYICQHQRLNLDQRLALIFFFFLHHQLYFASHHEGVLVHMD